DLLAMGPGPWIDQQLAPATIDDGPVEALLAGYTSLGASNQQNSTLTSLDELRHATFLRALASRRQLHAVMVDFWTNHVNAALDRDDRFRHLKIRDDREVVRANALGRFADLIRAS